MNNQRNLIINHIKNHGSISSMEAFSEYGITRLSGRIFELRKQGYNIRSKSETKTNRYGNKTTYSRYILEGENVQM